MSESLITYSPIPQWEQSRHAQEESPSELSTHFKLWSKYPFLWNDKRIARFAPSFTGSFGLFLFFLLKCSNICSNGRISSNVQLSTLIKLRECVWLQVYMQICLVLLFHLDLTGFSVNSYEKYESLMSRTLKLIAFIWKNLPVISRLL